MLAVLVLLARRMRRHPTVWSLTPSLDWTSDPPAPPHSSNDRSPFRPSRPTLSGGTALEVPRPPVDDDDDLTHAVA
jgi:hypothetical protein